MYLFYFTVSLNYPTNVIFYKCNFTTFYMTWVTTHITKQSFHLFSTLCFLIILPIILFKKLLIYNNDNLNVLEGACGSTVWLHGTGSHESFSVLFASVCSYFQLKHETVHWSRNAWTQTNTHFCSILASINNHHMNILVRAIHYLWMIWFILDICFILRVWWMDCHETSYRYSCSRQDEMQ